MLQKARKLGAERDSSSGKDRRGRPTKSRSRYQLFEEKATGSQRKKASTSGLEALLQQNIAAGSNALSPENVNLMVQMELPEGKVQKGKAVQCSRRTGRQRLQQSGEFEQSWETRRSKQSTPRIPSRSPRDEATPEKAYQTLHQGGGASFGCYKGHPLSAVRRHKKAELGKKQRSLLRIHYAASEVLQTLLQNKPELAALELVQVLRAIHQTCLDQGSWKASWLLLRYQDPVDVPRFGGEPQDLERVAGYLDALQKLEKRSKGLGKGDVADEEGGKGKKGKGNKQKQVSYRTSRAT